MIQLLMMFSVLGDALKMTFPPRIKRISITQKRRYAQML